MPTARHISKALRGRQVRVESKPTPGCMKGRHIGHSINKPPSAAAAGRWMPAEGGMNPTNRDVAEFGWHVPEQADNLQPVPF